jgi:glutathione S-transferase
MAIEVYLVSGSPYAWRVLLALEVKQVPYATRFLQMSDGTLKAPEYLALNPRGKVPTLKDGDYVVYESLAILAYLDGKYPAAPLFGETPEQAGVVWRIVSEYTAYMDAAVEELILPIYFGRAEQAADSIRHAAVTLRTELGRLEASLGRSPWLAGERISAADLTVFPAVQSILRASSKEAAKPFELGFLPLADRYPQLAAWAQRVEALPGYDRTYPPHWR